MVETGFKPVCTYVIMAGVETSRRDVSTSWQPKYAQKAESILVLMEMGIARGEAP